MFAEKEYHWRNDVGECDFELLDDGTESLNVKLGHDNKSETVVYGVMYETC